MGLNLTFEEAAALLALLTRVIDEDRYPLAPHPDCRANFTAAARIDVALAARQFPSPASVEVAVVVVWAGEACRGCRGASYGVQSPASASQHRLRSVVRIAPPQMEVRKRGRLPLPRPGVRSRSGQETFAGASGSDEDAPSVQIQSDDSLAATEGPGRPRRGVGRR